MARYGNQTTPFTEEMIPMPVDPYGISKVAGEEVLKNLPGNYAIGHNRYSTTGGTTIRNIQPCLLYTSPSPRDS